MNSCRFLRWILMRGDFGNSCGLPNATLDLALWFMRSDRDLCAAIQFNYKTPFELFHEIPIKISSIPLTNCNKVASRRFLATYILSRLHSPSHIVLETRIWRANSISTMDFIEYECWLTKIPSDGTENKPKKRSMRERSSLFVISWVDYFLFASSHLLLRMSIFIS